MLAATPGAGGLWTFKSCVRAITGQSDARAGSKSRRIYSLAPIRGLRAGPHCGKPQTEGRLTIGLQVANLPHKPAGLETRRRRGRPPHIDRSTRIGAAHEET